MDNWRRNTPMQNNLSNSINENNPLKYKEFSINSESIVSFIIEKIISLTITEAVKNQIDNKINSKCYFYISNIINNFIKVEYLAHDRDDRFLINKRLEKIKSNLDKNNIEILESESNLNDKFINKTLSNNIILNNSNITSSIDDSLKEDMENEFFTMNENKRKNIIVGENFFPFFDNKHIGINDWSICDEPAHSKIDRYATSMIKTIKPTFKDIPPKEQEIDINKSHLKANNSDMNKTNKSKFRTTTIIKIDAEDADKSHNIYHKEEILQYKLTNIEQFTEDSFIKDKRLEKEKQLQKEEEEKKIKKIQEREISEKNNEMLKRLKENQNKNFTTDVHGNILLIKGTGLEKLQGEFFFPKLNVLDKGLIQSNFTNAKTSKLKKEDQNNSRITSSKSKMTTKFPPPKMNQTENIQTNIQNNFEKDKNSIVPAGSSFDLISPEVGVTIFEGDKQKTGGNDYLKHFKKYSKYDYTQLVRETINANMTQNSAINRKNSKLDVEKTKLSDFNGVKIMNNTVSNFGLTREIFEEKNDENIIKAGIKFNTKYGTSLRTAMEKLDLIPEFDDSEIIGENKKLNNENLFKNKIINEKSNIPKLEKEQLDEINKFNNSILKDSNWGQFSKPSINEDVSINKMFFKPDKKELEKEIGKNIYNTKLPRARLLTRIKDPNTFNKVANKTSRGTISNFLNDSFYNKVFHKTAFYDKNAFKK